VTDGARRPGPADPRRPAVPGRRLDETDGYRPDGYGRAPQTRDDHYRDDAESRRGGYDEDAARPPGASGYETGRRRGGGDAQSHTGREQAYTGRDRDRPGSRGPDEAARRGSGPARGYQDEGTPHRRGGYRDDDARPAGGRGRQDARADRGSAPRRTGLDGDSAAGEPPAGPGPSGRGGGSGRFAARPATPPDERTGVAASDRAGSDRAGTNRTGTNRAGTSRTGTSRTGADRTGADRTGADRTGADRTGADRGGADRTGAGRAGAGRGGGGGGGGDRADRTRADRAGSARTGVDRDAERPWRTGQQAGSPREAADDTALAPARGTGPRRAAGAVATQGGTSSGGTGRFAGVTRERADDDASGTGSTSVRRPPDPGMGLFVRRLVIAFIWLGFALGLGVGAGVVWEKVRPSGDSVVTTVATATPTQSASGAVGSQPPAPTASPTSAVPADWVAYTATSTKAKSTFSHPGGWALREDSTGVFFGEATGPRMVGVVRRTGVGSADALSKVQALEFGGQPGLSVTGSGDVTDPVSGAKVRELTGTYVRQGQKVSYLMRSVDANGAVYVLIVRVAADSDSELDGLMSALRASFQPAA